MAALNYITQSTQKQCNRRSGILTAVLVSIQILFDATLNLGMQSWKENIWWSYVMWNLEHYTQDNKNAMQYYWYQAKLTEH